MSERSSSRQRRSKSGKRKKRNKGGRKEQFPQPRDTSPVHCSVCEKPIEIISTAVTGFSDDEVSHLECVIKQLEAVEELTSCQRIIYAGQGAFAVVEYKNEHKQGPFSVVRRITHETAEGKKKLNQTIQYRLPPVSM